MKFLLPFILLVGSILSSCVGLKKPPQPEPIEPRTLEHSFGNVNVTPQGAVIEYKNMMIGMNDAGNAGPFDYFLLQTDVLPSLSLPKNQKIIATPEQAARLVRQGYTNVKGLKSGPMVQFTKSNGFLFVRAFDHGYFLEFDNGKNILLLAEDVKPDMIRPFLYAIRDEGKEIHMGFFPMGKEQDNSLAEIISMLQPEVAVLTGGNAPDKKKTTELQKALESQMFEGSLFSSRSQDKFPF